MVNREGTVVNNETATQGAHYVTVEAPARYEGVGQALRAVFNTDCGSLPPEMTALLDQLKKH